MDFFKTSIAATGAFWGLWGNLCVASPDTVAKIEFFESKIRPVLVQYCYECHSRESGKSKGGLFLDSRIAWQVGGDSGPAIVPGNPDGSLLIQAISRSGKIPEMPPKSHLQGRVVGDFKNWIADGAVDPREGEAPAQKKESIDIGAARKFWSFQPRKKFAGKPSIDGFVKPRTKRAPADKLVRRLFLDLIGLPPTLEEQEEFARIHDGESPQLAMETFADRLLARKELGEKWARHWLDIVRYADSNGGDFNLTFHQSWRYRNYVIDAFNDDMPYDQFLTEQLAGDLLPFSTSEQRNRQLVATGFLMVSPKMLTERDKAKMYLDIADEQLDTLGKAVMGLALGCARCHDHKFDPIPTEDYYAMAGILHSTRIADKVLMNNVNVTGWTNTPMEMSAEAKETLLAHKAKIQVLEKELEHVKQLANKSKSDAISVVVDNTEAETTGPWRKSTLRKNRIGEHYLASDPDNGPYSITWRAELPAPGKYEVRVSFGGGAGLAKAAPYAVRHAGGETVVTINQTVKPTIDGLWFPIGQFEFAAEATSGEESKPARAEVRLTDNDAGGHVIADAVQFVQIGGMAKNVGSETANLPGSTAELEKQLKKLKDSTPKAPEAMAAMENKGDDKMGDLHIRIRGETANLGAEVPRGFLQVTRYEGQKDAKIPADVSGRIQLAAWLTHPNHPLTARVMANRVWQQLFGQGIVPTSDNFGTLGTPPSHPELLDHIAGEFVDNRWSVKSLVRKIVLSEAYQMESRTPAADNPDNLLLLHQNRRPAPAETLRDSILAIAGELDPTPSESVVAQLGMYAISTGGSRHDSLSQTGKLRKRSIYMPVVRGAVPPSLAVFGTPNPDLVTGKRAASIVPEQALFMMNSPFVRKMALATSKKLLVDGHCPEGIIRRLYKSILVREPRADEVEATKEYLQTLLQEDGKSMEEAVASFVQVLFGSSEFRFIE